MSGLRSVPSALPGDGVEAERPEQPYAPGASSTHSPLHSGSQVTPCLKASLPFPIFLSHTLALPSEVEGRESLVREDMVVRKRLFLQVCPPNPQIS